MRMWSDHARSAEDAEAAGLLVQQLGGKAADAVPHTAAPASASSCELHVKVRYTTIEYASFMWQHTRFLIRRRRVGFPLGWYLCLKSTAFAVLNFILLGRSRRTYEFTLDEHGIVRTTGTGVTLISWDDVVTVRRYARGPMLVLKRGTLPLPARCLNAAQMAALDTLLASRKEQDELA
jgi:hypothetical protein